MCGIAGLVVRERPAEWLRATAARMTAALHHRGPDDSGVWVSPVDGVALGHARLSILDLSPLGHQPMASASGRYVITYNGEVYNFAELRGELEALGARFRGTSDTEVVLAAVEAWGVEKAVARFVGMFAIGLWDTRTHELSLIRDRLGKKPLYWAKMRQGLLFGSELKALLACPLWQPELNRSAVAAYMRWNYVPTPLCIFDEAGKVEAGVILTFSASGAVRSTRYWSMRDVARTGVADPLGIRTETEAVDGVEALLRDAVRCRMRADVPVGVFLSGGIDSSVVTALMQQESARPVQSFTIGFRTPEYDEATFAKAVAQHIGTEHTEVYLGPEDALRLILRLPTIYDEPFADSSQLPTYLVSEVTRRQVTVALSGDGGDELFCGYTRYHWAEMIRRRFLPWPAAARHALAAVLEVPGRAGWELVGGMLPTGRRPQRLGERVSKLAGFLREADADGIYRRQHAQWTAPVVLGAEEARGIAFDATVASDIPDFLRRMQFLDTVMYLPDDILTKVDRASMAVSLEVRAPLLDHRLIEYVWRIPHNGAIRTANKHLLRQVLYRHVPRELLDRPKRGFSVPLGAWLRGPLRDWAEALLSREHLVQQGILDAGIVRSRWEGFLQGRNTDQEPLWGALMFQAWYSQYVGQPRAERQVA